MSTDFPFLWPSDMPAAFGAWHGRRLGVTPHIQQSMLRVPPSPASAPSIQNRLGLSEGLYLLPLPLRFALSAKIAQPPSDPHIPPAHGLQRTQCFFLRFWGILLPRAPVAQLDRALASGAKGRRFKSCRARLEFPLNFIGYTAGSSR